MVPSTTADFSVTKALSTTLTGSIHTSKNTGCLRMQPTGFDTSNHAAKILHFQSFCW